MCRSLKHLTGFPEVVLALLDFEQIITGFFGGKAQISVGGRKKIFNPGNFSCFRKTCLECYAD